jgi:hypothetical protein
MLGSSTCVEAGRGWAEARPGEMKKTEKRLCRWDDDETTNGRTEFGVLVLVAAKMQKCENETPRQGE